MISAFGNARLLSAISRPFTWSAWKCEITTTSIALRSMPAAARLALSVPRSPLLCADAASPLPVSNSTRLPPVVSTIGE